MGRFTSPDPSSTANLTNPGGWNRYAYANSDPVNQNDPSGLGLECQPRVIRGKEGYQVWGEVCVDVGGSVRPPPSYYQDRARAAHPRSDSYTWSLALRRLNQARDHILKKTDWSSDCLEDLKGMGMTLDDFKNALKEATFLNGVSDKTPITVGVIWKENTTPAEYFGDNPLINGMGDLDVNRSWYRPSAINDAEAGADVFALVTHEVGHYVTGKGDWGLLWGLGYVPFAPWNDSHRITEKSKQDCFD